MPSGANARHNEGRPQYPAQRFLSCFAMNERLPRGEAGFACALGGEMGREVYSVSDGPIKLGTADRATRACCCQYGSSPADDGGEQTTRVHQSAGRTGS